MHGGGASEGSIMIDPGHIYRERFACSTISSGL